MGPAAVLDVASSAESANVPPRIPGKKRQLNLFTPAHAKMAIISESEPEANAVQNQAVGEVVSVLRDSESVAGTSGNGTSTSSRSILWKTISSLKLADVEAASFALRKRKNFLTYGMAPTHPKTQSSPWIFSVHSNVSSYKTSSPLRDNWRF